MKKWFVVALCLGLAAAGVALALSQDAPGWYALAGLGLALLFILFGPDMEGGGDAPGGGGAGPPIGGNGGGGGG